MVARKAKSGQPRPEKRREPEYPLSKIRELAGELKVSFQSRKVTNDVDGLGYTQDIVCDCLGNLKDADFHESIRYAGDPRWHDVYKCAYMPPPFDRFKEFSQPDSLYIKLILEQNGSSVKIASFHLNGAS